MSANRAYLLLGAMTLVLLAFTVLVRTFMPTPPPPRIQPAVTPDNDSPAMITRAPAALESGSRFTAGGRAFTVTG